MVFGGCLTGIIPTGKVNCFVSSVAAVPMHFVPKSRQPNFMKGSCSMTSRTNSLMGKILLCSWRLRLNVVDGRLETFTSPWKKFISFKNLHLWKRCSGLKRLRWMSLSTLRCCRLQVMPRPKLVRKPKTENEKPFPAFHFQKIISDLTCSQLTPNSDLTAVFVTTKLIWFSTNSQQSSTKVYSTVEKATWPTETAPWLQQGLQLQKSFQSLDSFIPKGDISNVYGSQLFNDALEPWTLFTRHPLFRGDPWSWKTFLILIITTLDWFFRGGLAEILCKPKILPLKSAVLEQLQRIEREIEVREEGEEPDNINIRDHK